MVRYEGSRKKTKAEAVILALGDDIMNDYNNMLGSVKFTKESYRDFL